MANTQTQGLEILEGQRKQEFKNFTHSMKIMGKVVEVDIENAAFRLKCRNGTDYLVKIGAETWFSMLQNLDKLGTDRFPNPENFDYSNPSDRVKKYLKKNMLVSVYGIFVVDENKKIFEGRAIELYQEYDKTGSYDDNYIFEKGHWWLTQINALGNTWLDYLFGDAKTYDFSKYRTNIGITGLPSDDKLQECATLSRLIYGLSSAYLLTGCERFLNAATEGVKYQREKFRSLSHDGKHIFWAYGRKITPNGQAHSELIIPSQNNDDLGTIPLYEQIYALAGITQYYRITSDWEALEDIKRTVKTFNDFYLDPDENYGGYFSHIDYVTLSWNSDVLAERGSYNNKAKKNWNSVGDHIPAYLVNLVLALDPLPKNDDYEDINEFVNKCKKILDETSSLIAEKFTDTNESIPYVNERFFRDWTPDQTWGWQQDRAVCGHNFKIAWNLTRVANYYEAEKHQLEQKNKEKTHPDSELIERVDATQIKINKLMKMAKRLGDEMAIAGIDQVRSGVFDVVERKPMDELTDFAWGNTKDFWQQEQGILAYLILYGYYRDDEDYKENTDNYKALARELMAFWNRHYLDLDSGGVFFRVTDDGIPDIRGQFGTKGGHSISGYHAFELNYLAHIYIKAFVTRSSFCLYFKPNLNNRSGSINVLPDFVKPNTLYIKSITIDGKERTSVDRHNFQVELCKSECNSSVVVEFDHVSNL